MLSALVTLAMLNPGSANFQAPAGQRYAKVVPGGITILPNGRFLTPTGKRLFVGEDLWQVRVSAQGAVVGFHDGGMSVFTQPLAEKPERQVLTRKEIAPAAEFTPDGKILVVSLGDEGALELLDVSNWSSIAKINLNEGEFNDSYINDLVISRDGKYAYGVDITQQQLVTVDLTARKMVNRVRAGRQPYALTLSDDGKRLFICNIGIFDYSLIPPPQPGKGDPRGLSKPAFGFPGKESRDGIEMEGRKVPGLGVPTVEEAQSVWSYELAQPNAPKIHKQVKSGILIHGMTDGGKAVGGSAPNALLAHGGKLYVSNANNDTVQVFNQATLRSEQSVKLVPEPRLGKLRGVIPSGMAISKDGQRLFVCESGINSIAVFETKTMKVLGRIPTGWFPMQVRLSPDEKHLAIATQKGIGRGPRGPLHRRQPGDERHGFSDMPGMVDYAPVPTDAHLRAGHQTVLRNNGMIPGTPRQSTNPVPAMPGKPSQEIEYVVFITKENHTFDGIFGELKERGAVAEPEYAEFGNKGWIREKGKAERLPIMPNHIRLANQFAISDNFYMEPQASGDGHRWLIGVYPSLWTTRVFYAGWDHKFTDKAKGRLVSFGSDGSQIPEDYLENGSMFEHLHRNGITFRNYGEGYELPRTDEGWMTNRAGTFYQTNFPMPKVLFENSDFDFPAYNTNIPDIARADWFVEDIELYRKANKGKLPRFINIAICNDHGDSPRPERGYPYVCSYMADNDLALGRIVEYLTKQPEWKKMAIIVTQDDPGGDNDMVDRHRSFVLVISPFAKRGHISRDHTSIMSIIKTIYLIFGLGPNNLFDAVVTPLDDMFQSKPDYTGYQHVMTDPRVFKPTDTFDPFDPKFEKRRREPSVKMDDPKFLEWLNKNSGNKGN